MGISHNTSREDIVITGMSCRFAESGNLEMFWRRIMTRKSCFSLLFPEQQADGNFSPRGKSLFNRQVPRYGARLGDLYACNPADQYFPHEINAGENQDVFFAVQLAIDALRDSGGSARSLPTDRISLHLGYAPPFNAASVNWLQHTFFMEQTLGIVRTLFPDATQGQLAEIQTKLVQSLPAANPYSMLSAMGSMITSWTAHLLGFAGPAFVIDAGAASAHQAIQGAMDDLLSRRADIALAGAIQPPLLSAFLEGLSGTFYFTAAKTLQPFGRDSVGTLPGEGGAVFVLKRLKDALRQGDHIYAIVRSTGIVAASLDAHQHVPAPQRLERAIRRALREAGSTPDSIQLFEAHGSGIPHSDQTELDVLQEMIGPRTSGQPLVGIGSVKGNVGHTLWASGAAGMVKAALSIAHRLLPPTVHIDRPYPKIISPKSPFYLLNEARPWLRGNKKTPRRACVTAIDFTGTCAAAILEEYPE